MMPLPAGMGFGKPTTAAVSSADSLRPMFGVALNNLGNETVAYTNNSVWNTFMETIKFTEGAFTGGAEARWVHYQSKSGGFNSQPDSAALHNVTNTGMRANPNEIYYFQGVTGNGSGTPGNPVFTGALDLHIGYNATGIDFFNTTLAYCVAHNMAFVYTANVTHGTKEDMGLFLNDLIAAGVNIRLRYDQEVATGDSGPTPQTSITSAQYITKVIEFDNYIKANYPTLKRCINTADHATSNWSMANVAQLAKDQGIQEFSQYFWLGDNAGNKPVVNNNDNIDAWFTLALSNSRDDLSTTNNSSLYGEILPRLQVYYDLFQPVKMNVAQYGCSMQRTGYVASTMLHGMLIWNELFEFWKFNSTHNNFVNSGTFLVVETAISKKTGNDNQFVIDPSYQMTSGSTTYIKRIQGVAYELLQPLSTYNVGYPTWVPTTFTNKPDKLDAVSWQVGSDTYIYIYNILGARTITSITRNGSALATNIDKTGCYSTKIYGSIGSFPGHSYFKTTKAAANPTYTATPINPISSLNISPTNISVPEHSILKIKLLGVSTATTSLVLNF